MKADGEAACGRYLRGQVLRETFAVELTHRNDLCHPHVECDLRANEHNNVFYQVAVVPE